MDINNFKSFNDRCGFEKGDDVLRQTAKILLETRHAVAGDRECFIGHIGGDDFIAVLHPDLEEAFARHFIAAFDRIIPTYYNEEDQKRGMIRVLNRQGKYANFPLMSCSVAACSNQSRNYQSLGEIAQDAADLKAFLKSQPGSHYLRDRRTSPIRNASAALEILGPEIKAKAAKPKPETQEPDPLGQVLLNAGLITQDALDRALKKHLESGQRLGQVLIAMNAVKSEEVGRMLEKKLNVPYVSLRRFMPPSDTMGLFSVDFIRSHRALPIEITAKGLKLGMCDPFDLKTLDAVERITGMKPIPYLALEDEFKDFLEKTEKLAERRERAV